MAREAAAPNSRLFQSRSPPHTTIPLPHTPVVAAVERAGFGHAVGEAHAAREAGARGGGAARGCGERRGRRRRRHGRGRRGGQWARHDLRRANSPLFSPHMRTRPVSLRAAQPPRVAPAPAPRAAFHRRAALRPAAAPTPGPPPSAPTWLLDDRRGESEAEKAAAAAEAAAADVATTASAGPALLAWLAEAAGPDGESVGRAGRSRRWESVSEGPRRRLRPPRLLLFSASPRRRHRRRPRRRPRFDRDA